MLGPSLGGRAKRGNVRRILFESKLGHAAQNSRQRVQRHVTDGGTRAKPGLLPGLFGELAVWRFLAFPKHDDEP